MSDKAQALKYFNKGQISKAGKLYTRALKQNQNDPETHYMLGVIYGQVNDLKNAEKHFTRAIELYPQSAMSVCGLATVYKTTNPEKSAELYLKAYELNPNLHDAYYEYAATKFVMGEHQTAMDACFTILSRDANYAKAYLLLGNIKQEARDTETANKYYNDAIKLNPEFGEAWNQLGILKYRMGHMAESIECFEKSMKYITPNFDPYIPYGRVLMSYGDIDKAEQVYRNALKANRNNIDAIAGLGSVYEYRKLYDEANELMLPHIKAKKTPSINLAAVYNKVCKKLGTCEQLIDYIDYVMEVDTEIDWNNKSIIHFTKANVFESLGSYDQAFAEYKNGNDLAPDNYEPTVFEITVSELKKVYSYDYFLQAKKSRNDRKYIFIVGMPRSGTSLVEQVIDSHSEVYGAGELDVLQGIVKTIQTPNQVFYPRCMPMLDEEALDRYANAYTREVDKIANTELSIISDKMPHNFLNVGLITQLFPNSKIVHCKRDPVDTSLSIYFQNFNDTHSYANKLENIAHHYKVYTDLMQHWSSCLGDRLHTVVYEDMVDNFDTQARELIEFCGLEWEDQCAEFFKNKRHVSTASQNQVNKPIYSSSVARWKKYEDDITVLLDKLREYKLID